MADQSTAADQRRAKGKRTQRPVKVHRKKTSSTFVLRGSMSALSFPKLPGDVLHWTGLD